MTLGAFSEPWEHNEGWYDIHSSYDTLRYDHDDPEYVPKLSNKEYRDIGNWIRRNNKPHWDEETIRVECDNNSCDTWFPKQRSLIRKTDHHSCKHDCYLEWNRGSNHYNWEGGVDDYYGETWREQRRKAYERDKKKCQDCGIEQNDHIAEYGCSPHVHHIVPHRLFDDTEKANQLTNLITLCTTCHRKHENWADYVSRKQGFK